MRDRWVRGLLGRLPGRSRPRTAIAAIGAIAVAALAVGIIVGAGLTSSSRGASPAAKVSGATTVQRRNLVATDTESGTLTYANPQTVYNRISGTITWLPAVGQLIKPGHALYYVDNQPVVLFNGTTPAYRTLSSGISNGPDVKELNRGLVGLGFDPNHEITVNDTWQTGTTDAVDRWQSSLGESQTGSVTLGQIVFLPGAQRVTTVEAVLGSNGSSGGAGSGSGNSSATAGSTDPRPEFASLETTTPTATTPAPKSAGSCRASAAKSRSHKRRNDCRAGSSQAALLALLRAETLELQQELASSGHARGGSAAGGSAAAGGAARGGAATRAGGGGSGSGGGSVASGGTSAGAGAGATAQPILQTTSNQLTVVVDLDATKQSEAVVGEPVTVQMPSGSLVNGRITQVSPIAQSSSSGSGSNGSGGSGNSGSTPSATIPVTVALHGHLPASGLDQAAVSVNFEQQKASNVLSVPVTALLATAGGGYAVQEAAPPHRLLPITPGLFAAGYVQISGAQIYPGLQVTDSQG